MTVLAASATAQAPAYTLNGTSPLDHFGFSVGGGVDVNADGYDDVIVGSPEMNARDGEVRVHSGRDGSLLLARIGSSQQDLGVSVAGVGDLNSDGHGDFIVGAARDSALYANGGRAFVLSGANGAVLLTLAGDAPGQQFGTSVARAGDADGDGIEDLIVGAPWANVGAAQGAGMARVFSGANGAVLHSFFGQLAGERLGNCVSTAGDVDGDGRDDVIVGEIGSNHAGSLAGRALVYSGRDGALLLTLDPDSAGDSFGFWVAGTGDVNHDGHDDVLVGAPTDAQNGLSAGAAFVFSGANGTVLRKLLGASNTLFGFSVAGGSDSDGDGVPDFAIGARRDTLAGNNAGSVRVVSGASGLTLYTAYGSVGDELGFSVAFAGDQNRDGRADVVAGAPFDSPGISFAGSARVFLGGCPAPLTYCVAKVNSLGCTPSISAQGAPSVSIADAFTLRATNVRNQRPGVLLWSYGPNAQPFGGGILCVSGYVGIARLGLQLAGGSPAGIADCSGNYAVHFSHAYMASKGLVPGARVFAQFYSRDPGFSAPNDVGFTDAVSFEICP
jgi:hypothetical protein